MATAEREMRRWQISARSPCGPPRLRRTVSLAPQTCLIIERMRASAPIRSRVHCARAWARERQLPLISCVITGCRFVFVPKSLRIMFMKE